MLGAWLPSGAGLRRRPWVLGSQAAERLDRVGLPWSALRGVRDKVEQRTVRIAEIQAGARALGAEALHRSGVNGNAAAAEVCDRICDRPFPFKAKVAVAWLDGKARHFSGREAGPVQIELHRTEAIGPAIGATDQLGA